MRPLQISGDFEIEHFETASVFNDKESTPKGRGFKKGAALRVFNPQAKRSLNVVLIKRSAHQA